MKRLLGLCIISLTVSLLIPCPASAKRPPKKQSVYLSDYLRKASELEQAGDPGAAEDVLLELYEATKKKEFRDESEWQSHMHVLRNIIAFYYRQREFKEAEWYHMQYADELEDDDEESGMHAIIVYDVTDIASDLIDKGKFQTAEETFLYLTDRLEERFGYRHWLVRLVYKNIIALYVRMGNREKAEEYGRKLNPVEQ